jgi:hypothetical protein
LVLRLSNPDRAIVDIAFFAAVGLTAHDAAFRYSLTR